MDLLTHENVEAHLKAKGLALLEPVDLKLGYRPYRGELAHDLAAVAEQDFKERAWSKVPEKTKQKYLRTMLEGVFEVRGRFDPEVVKSLPADVRVE